MDMRQENYSDNDKENDPSLPNQEKSVNGVQYKQGLSLGIRCIILLVLAASIGIFISKLVTYGQLSSEAKELQNEKQALEEKMDEMNHVLDGAVDYDEIVRIAREKFHLAFPGDTIYYNGQGTED